MTRTAGPVPQRADHARGRRAVRHDGGPFTTPSPTPVTVGLGARAHTHALRPGRVAPPELSDRQTAAARGSVGPARSADPARPADPALLVGSAAVVGETWAVAAVAGCPVPADGSFSTPDPSLRPSGPLGVRP
ncbi:hypothetical protein ACH47Z_18960 [Streptomyces sp. NPDC020192]|uniref:hypothetical protein n=1 Tax=Streptomyces sp. NPDC020192 TaxID=3365066 RepID=UPI003789236E